MNTYKVIFAVDVPHYGGVTIEATNDTDAIEAARRYWDRVLSGEEPNPATDSDGDSAVRHRIVEITDGEDGEVACDVSLDDYHLRFGGDADRRLCAAASDLLRGLETALQILRRIADALHYEHDLPVTFLESREIADLYADATGQTDDLEAILKAARGSS